MEPNPEESKYSEYEPCQEVQCVDLGITTCKTHNENICPVCLFCFHLSCDTDITYKMNIVNKWANIFADSLKKVAYFNINYGADKKYDGFKSSLDHFQKDFKDL